MTNFVRAFRSPAMVFGLFNFYENHGIKSEIDPDGSIWAHTKAGESYIAEDNF